MTKKIDQYREEYAEYLGREWGGQKGGDASSYCMTME